MYEPLKFSESINIVDAQSVETAEFISLGSQRGTKHEAKGKRGAALGRCFMPTESTGVHGVWATGQPGGRRRHLPATRKSWVESHDGAPVVVTRLGR